MLWRSVVGKLWVTILILVLIVLFTLTMLLTQFFENFHEGQARDQMTKMADKIALVMENDSNNKDSIRIIREMAEAYSMSIMIAANDKHEFAPQKQSDNPRIPLSVFLADKDLSLPMVTGKRIFTKGDYPVIENAKPGHLNMLIYGEHYKSRTNQSAGSIYVYQSMENIQETTARAKKLIFIAAGIATILTTIFAFFLSTRITAPLRKMREAATFVAKGEFDMKVPILTHDEIGELAMTFNRMGRQLKNFITALNQEKEQLSSVLSSMADGVITFDRQMNILVTNPPADRFLKACSNEQNQLHLNENTLPSDIKQLFEQVVSLEREQMTEIIIQGRWWVVVMTPLYNQSFIRGAVAVIRDMTDERRLDKLREDFVANVSHELKTPIAMLQGYSEAIVDDVAGTEDEKKELAGIILDESRRMGRLVNELLDLARLEAGHMKLHYSKFSLVEFSERVIRKFQGPAKDRGIHISLNIQSELKEMNADQDRLEQVLTNLIDNAIRHTSVDGKVTLAVSATEKMVKMDVLDNGSGIAEEDLPFVFERFYKADKARTRGKSGGTGLGLAIAKNIVEAHGGQITVRSKTNEGTTFSFVLPRNLSL